MRQSALLLALVLGESAAHAQSPRSVDDDEIRVSLDLDNVELSEFIAPMTGRTIIYDERVRGRVTVEKSDLTIEQAYAAFESSLRNNGLVTASFRGNVRVPREALANSTAPTNLVVGSQRDQSSTTKSLNLRKSFTFAVTTIRSLTLAIAAICPSAAVGGRPRLLRRARSRACQVAASWS